MLAQCKHTECTVSKHCSGHWRFLYILVFATRAAPNSEKINIDFVCETVNFGSLNLTILKKKSKNTTKYHNIFTISSFLESE